MGFLSFLSKPKPEQKQELLISPKPPEFHFIKGEYIYDSKDFEVLAYAKYKGEYLNPRGVHYLLRTKGNVSEYFVYCYNPEYPNSLPEHNLTREYRETVMSRYLEFSKNGWYSDQHYNKTYEEAFDIKLKHVGEGSHVKKIDKPINQPKPHVIIDDTNFLEI